MLLGIAAYLAHARSYKEWPFGKKVGEEAPVNP